MEDFSRFSIYPGTPEQILESRRRSFVEWGRGMTEEQYVKRDTDMDSLEHAVDGKLITWVLAPKDDPTTLEFKCSCETFKRKGTAFEPSGTALKNASEVSCYSIASVFTLFSFRKKGYARYMMRLLHWAITSHELLPPFPKIWGEPPPSVGDAKFSVLYSDVGQFYATCGPDRGSNDGWITRSAYSTVWNVSSTISQMDSDPQVSYRWLDIPAAKMIWKDDAKAMRAELVQSAMSRGRSAFTFLPLEGVAAFQIYRCHPAAIDGSEKSEYKKWGIAMDCEASKGFNAALFATWSFDMQSPPPTLIITRIRADPTQFPVLLAFIVAAAREYEMHKIEIWNLPADLEHVAAELGGKTVKRGEHLPAVRWYGREDADDVDWVFNEKHVPLYHLHLSLN